jgi:SLOG cluster2
MHDPVLVPTDALKDTVVGISVSHSADLSRLGLSPAHCDLVVAELARAIFLAGGTIVYGGRLVPAGFTDILLSELRGYREDRNALVLCVPETEHRRLSDDELTRRERELHASAELVCLDADGNPVDVHHRPTAAAATDTTAALSAMRQHITNRCDARVIVGGKLRGYQGKMPGVLEEANLSVNASQPLYVAGGFGGAAAAVAIALGRTDDEPVPPGYPDGIDDHGDLLAEIAAAERAAGGANDGLDGSQRPQLAWSHRPGEIASLVVLGLGRARPNRQDS